MTRTDVRQVYAACWAVLLGLGLIAAGLFLNLGADYAAVLCFAIVGTATKERRG